MTPHTRGYGEYLQTGGRWVHPRLCTIGGRTGGCDFSPNRHATRHFHSTHHTMIKSFEPGGKWGWCYADEVELDLD